MGARACCRTQQHAKGQGKLQPLSPCSAVACSPIRALARGCMPTALRLADQPPLSPQQHTPSSRLAPSPHPPSLHTRSAQPWLRATCPCCARTTWWPPCADSPRALQRCGPLSFHLQYSPPMHLLLYLFRGFPESAARVRAAQFPPLFSLLFLRPLAPLSLISSLELDQLPACKPPVDCEAVECELPSPPPVLPVKCGPASREPTAACRCGSVPWGGWRSCRQAAAWLWSSSTATRRATSGSSTLMQRG